MYQKLTAFALHTAGQGGHQTSNQHHSTVTLDTNRGTQIRKAKQESSVNLIRVDFQF